MKVIQLNSFQHVFVDHIETIEEPIGPPSPDFKSAIRTHSGRVLHSKRSVADLLEEIQNWEIIHGPH